MPDKRKIRAIEKDLDKIEISDGKTTLLILVKDPQTGEIAGGEEQIKEIEEAARKSPGMPIIVVDR